jgi:hypothetical protein
MKAVSGMLMPNGEEVVFCEELRKSVPNIP